MHIVIIGTGGVGGYFGAKLARAGHQVTFVARGAHLAAMQTNGLSIKSIQGDFKLNNIIATDDIICIQNSDLILVTTKTDQVKEVAEDISKIINNKTIVIPLQNGVLAADELGEYISNGNIIPGLCQIISKIEAPAVINHFGIDPLIIIGEMYNEISPRAKKIQKYFHDAGIELKISENIKEDLWRKFILICVGGLLALCRCTYGEAREIRETRKLMRNVMQEAWAVSKAAGLDIEQTFIEDRMQFIDDLPFEATSSLCRDIWAGKPSEINSKNGAIVQLGEQYGVATPVNTFICHALMPLEKRAIIKLKL